MSSLFARDRAWLTARGIIQQTDVPPPEAVKDAMKVVGGKTVEKCLACGHTINVATWAGYENEARKDRARAARRARTRATLATPHGHAGVGRARGL